MARIELPEGFDLERSRMWQLARPLGRAASNFSTVMYDERTISLRELELARMRIAEINACPI